MGWHSAKWNPIYRANVDDLPTEVVECLGRQPSLVLDIGSNDASTSLQFVRLFPSVAVVAFEPDIMEAQTALSRTRGLPVSIIASAVTDVDGLVEFRRSSGRRPGWRGLLQGTWRQSGSVREPLRHRRVWPWVKFESPALVPSVRLDTWHQLAGSPDIDLIWMDVQGAEDLVFEGARNTLKHTDYVYTEYSDEEWFEGSKGLTELLEMLPGWQVVQLFPGNALIANRQRIDCKFAVRRSNDHC